MEKGGDRKHHKMTEQDSGKGKQHMTMKQQDANGNNKHKKISEQQDSVLTVAEGPGGLFSVKYGIKLWKPYGTRDVRKNQLHIDPHMHIVINVSMAIFMYDYLF